MGRRHGGWPERVPGPKAAKLSKEELQRLQARTARFVQESIILRELVEGARLERHYRWRESEDLMARITPLGPRSMCSRARRRQSEGSSEPEPTYVKVRFGSRKRFEVVNDDQYLDDAAKWMRSFSKLLSRSWSFETSCCTRASSIVQHSWIRCSTRPLFSRRLSMRWLPTGSSSRMPMMKK